MTLLFLSLAVIIAIIVILVSVKHIKKGFEARSEVKDQIRNENISEDDEDILDKLKNENLTQEELKKIYDDLKKKK